MSIYEDFQRDAADAAKYVNEDGLVTSRYGPQPKKTWLYLQREFEKAIPFTKAGEFATGFTYESTNQVGIDGSNNAWIYNGEVPFTVAPGTVPSEPDYTQVFYADVDNLLNVDQPNQFDDYYIRKISLSDAVLKDFSVGTVLSITDRLFALYEVVSGETANGFDIVSMSNGNQLKLSQNHNDPRAWGAGGDGYDATDVLQRMCDVGQNIYMKAPAGEDWTWNLSGDVEVKSDGAKIQMTSNITIQQTSNNTKTFWSGLTVNNVTYKKMRLRGVGASDTASTVNADNGTVNAQAYGILFQGSGNFTTIKCDVRYFKNDGIRSEYSSNVNHVKPYVEGTLPDPDIPEGVTSRQQFGISVWASTYAERGSSAQSIREGTATPHGGENIKIEDSEIGNTAIATCVFPGYFGVQLKGQRTFGRLAQHSVYAYAGNDLLITNYDYTPERQDVGIKISNNVLANRIIPNKIRIGQGFISNTYSPSISIECFDKFDNGDFDVSKSGCFFENLEIDGPIITDYYDIGMSVACAYGRIGNVRLSNQSGTASLRPPIDLRSFGGEIHDTVIKKCDRSAIGGIPALVKALTLRNNTMIDAASAVSSVYLSLAPAVAPMELTADRWYAKGNYVYNPANDEVFRVVTTGYTSGTIPTGSGTRVFGTASITYIGLFADMQTYVNLYDNIYDIEQGTLSTQAVSLNNAKFTTKVKGDWAENTIKRAQIQGVMEMWQGTNLGNTSKVAVTIPGYGAIGTGGNVYYMDAIPTSGTFEKDDIIFYRNRVAGGKIGANCVARGTPGTWKEFGDISV